MLEHTLTPILLPQEQDSFTISEMLNVIQQSYGFNGSTKQIRTVRRKIEREISKEHPEKKHKGSIYPRDYVFRLLNEDLRDYLNKQKIRYGTERKKPEAIDEAKAEQHILSDASRYEAEYTEEFAEFQEGYIQGEPIPGPPVEDEIKLEIEQKKREAVITYLMESVLDELIDFDSDKLEADLRHQPDSGDGSPSISQISARCRLTDIHNYFTVKKDLWTFIEKHLK